jgi:hypothetical protein
MDRHLPSNLTRIINRADQNGLEAHSVALGCFFDLFNSAEERQVLQFIISCLDDGVLSVQHLLSYQYDCNID